MNVKICEGADEELYQNLVEIAEFSASPLVVIYRDEGFCLTRNKLNCSCMEFTSIYTLDGHKTSCMIFCNEHKTTTYSNNIDLTVENS